MDPCFQVGWSVRAFRRSRMPGSPSGRGRCRPCGRRAGARSGWQYEGRPPGWSLWCPSPAIADERSPRVGCRADPSSAGAHEPAGSLSGGVAPVAGAGQGTRGAAWSVRQAGRQPRLPALRQEMRRPEMMRRQSTRCGGGGDDGDGLADAAASGLGVGKDPGDDETWSSTPGGQRLALSWRSAAASRAVTVAASCPVRAAMVAAG